MKDNRGRFPVNQYAQRLWIKGTKLSELTKTHIHYLTRTAVVLVVVFVFTLVTMTANVVCYKNRCLFSLIWEIKN